MDWLEDDLQEVAIAEAAAVLLSILHLREVFNHGIVTDHKDHPLTQLYLNVLACIVYRRRKVPKTAYVNEDRGVSVFYMRSEKNNLRRFLGLWVETFTLYYTTTVAIQLMMGELKPPSLQSMLTFLLAVIITHYSPGDVLFTVAQHDAVKHALNLRYALGRVRALNKCIGRAQATGHGYLFQFIIGIIVMDFWPAFVYLFDRFMRWPFALFIRRLPKEFIKVAKNPATAVGIGSSLLTIVSLHYDKYVEDPENIGAIGLHLLLYIALNIKYSLPYNRVYYTLPQLMEKPGHLASGIRASVTALGQLTMEEYNEISSFYVKQGKKVYKEVKHLRKDAENVYASVVKEFPQSLDEWGWFLFKNKVFIVQTAAILLAIAEPASRLVLSYLVMIGATLETAKSLLDPAKTQQRREWIIFWVFFQVFEAFEETNFGLYRKLPGRIYFLAKIAFLHWLTAYGGAALIYKETFSVPPNLRDEFKADFAHLAVRQEEVEAEGRVNIKHLGSETKATETEQLEVESEEYLDPQESEVEEEKEEEEREEQKREDDDEELEEGEEENFEVEAAEDEGKAEARLEGSTNDGIVEEGGGEDEEEFSVNPLAAKTKIQERPRDGLAQDYGFYASKSPLRPRGRKKSKRV